jgi:DNA-binding beta-propeller fold protein YncE
MTGDASANSFLATGVLFDIGIHGLGEFVLVGTGSTSSPDNIYLYATPFTNASKPLYEMSSASCSTAPTGPTGIALYLNLSTPLSSEVLITSYYNNEVAEYPAADFIGGAANPCPTPTTTGSLSQVSAPEGVAVDASGTNVFVSNAGGNTITVYGSGGALAGAPIFTLHN